MSCKEPRHLQLHTCRGRHLLTVNIKSFSVSLSPCSVQVSALHCLHGIPVQLQVLVSVETPVQAPSAMVHLVDRQSATNQPPHSFPPQVISLITRREHLPNIRKAMTPRPEMPDIQYSHQSVPSPEGLLVLDRIIHPNPVPAPPTGKNPLIPELKVCNKIKI